MMGDFKRYDGSSYISFPEKLSTVYEIITGDGEGDTISLIVLK
jgi:hypothetical protein